jgi:pimeloyl-ACP methyl ester carboxylesterase
MILLAQLLWMWVYGLLSVALIVLALGLLYRVFRQPKRRVLIRKPGIRRDDLDSGMAVVAVSGSGGDLRPIVRYTMISVAVLLLGWSMFGRHIALLLRPADSTAPGQVTSNSMQTIARPDGTQLHVESYGPANGPVLILTHGWSLDMRAWDYAKRDLSNRFRVITWDLPGLGRSTEPGNRDYSLDKMAADLGAVLQWAGRPAVLAGHSIGGMINLTYCRQHPEQLGREVAGLIQINTTYTNPVKTTSSSSFDTAMQKPVYEPLLHITIVASPLVRAMNWMSYHNGLAHVMTASSSFAGAETREQLDYAARRNYEASPAVVARGMLAMLRWDATSVLPGVRVQTLIVGGEQDTTTTPAASRYMREAMPAAEMQTVNRAAHLGLLEQNRIYNEAIRRFADSCFDGSHRLVNAM